MTALAEVLNDVPVRVTSSVAPGFAVIAPTVNVSEVAVLRFWTIVLAPELSVRPLTVWAFTVVALPVRVSVPPPRVRALVEAKMFETGEVACEKSSVRPPTLTAVAPV